jgi:hypothetical protein
LLKPNGRLICETPCLGESGTLIRWLINFAGRIEALPRVHCFEIAELKSMIANESPLRLVEAESAAENRTHLFVVAEKA